ncbi:MAG: hypothetical protein PVH64_05605 [Bacillota bacterium]
MELKRWAGEAAHRRDLKQLADYLERQGCTFWERTALPGFSPSN